MAKDPAFLFYYQDFLVGTSFLTNEETGAFIKILSHLADKGALPEEHMLNICQSENVWKSIKNKFRQDENGLYFNERLRTEVDKRKKYAESRRKNRKRATNNKDMKNISTTYVKHMENENENKDGIVNKDLKERKEDFQKELFRYSGEYAPDMIDDFYQYWSESDSTNKIMKFELQQTWDLAKRLVTWKRNGEKWNEASKPSVTKDGIWEFSKSISKDDRYK